MKIVIAPDKFKDCLSAPKVAEAIAAGIHRADADAQIDLCPMADGGEGTVAALVAATGGRVISRRVTGPLPHMKVDAEFGILGDNQTAVIEMAAASGLHLLKPADRDPMNTTTYGTGELLRAVTDAGARSIILGIGGSATTDGGIGCAQAMGAKIQLDDGQPTAPLCGRDVARVKSIALIESIDITVACDVSNPLFGENGAARIYGPQKGATPQQVEMLDAALKQLAQRTGRHDQATIPGAGAAGGLGFGLLAFFRATLRPGIDIVIEATDLRQRLTGATLCITGEGKLDAQSLSGKTVVGVARLCKQLGVPCIALVGAVAEGAEQSYNEGIIAYFSICDGPMNLETSFAQTRSLLEATAENVARIQVALSRRD